MGGSPAWEHAMIKKYRKKPVVIEAIQWTGYNLGDCLKFTGEFGMDLSGDVYVRTLEGSMKVSVGDYIIKGVKGEFYPCKPDVFAATYEEMAP